MKCGIMDQFIIGMGKENHAILLNTDTLEYEYSLIDLKAYTFIIVNTNKQRGLADSKYNERRQECQASLKILKEVIEIKAGDKIEIKMMNGGGWAARIEKIK